MELRIKLNDELKDMINNGVANAYKIVKFVMENTEAVNTSNKDLKETALMDLSIDNKNIIACNIDTLKYIMIITLEDNTIEEDPNNRMIIELINNPAKCTIKKLASETKCKQDYNYIINYYNERAKEYDNLPKNKEVHLFHMYYNIITYNKVLYKNSRKRKLIDMDIYNNACEQLELYNFKNYSDDYMNMIKCINVE